MMDNFRIIYKILKAFEKSMDAEEFNNDLIVAEQLGISEMRWKKIMKMLADEGYLEGVHVIQPDSGILIIKIRNPGITLKGLEYLNDNSLMKKAANLAKGITDIVS